jgi:Fic family protein
VPILIKAGLVHVQFETIHPFLDGNGHLGRLLITFLLCASGALRQPMLYLSLYLKTHRSTYYELLNRVRSDGDWEAWIAFFLRGVKETVELAVHSARRMLALFDQDRRRVEENVGRAAGSALRLLQFSQGRPVFNISQASLKLGLSQPTIIKSIGELSGLGIFAELTGKKRDRVFCYRAYLDILNEGTDPLPPG